MKNSKSKTRFMGLCKLLLGLTLLAPAPATCITHSVLAAKAANEVKETRARFEQTVDYQNALINREKLIKQNEEDVSNRVKSPKQGVADKEYYQSQQYIDDCIDLKENGILKKTQKDISDNIVVAVLGTIAAGCVSALFAIPINQLAPNSRHQFDLIGYGAKELVTGEKGNSVTSDVENSECD